ncbi:zinc-binding alcohol dehydrogenase family protein [Agrobacterium vitis]|uniref:Zinc-binding alcohol dehydrogenase family protein n=1 Tax=Agrobacterium vitis TaxID=373 RepID=A0AAE2UWJ6_AGRVI|nr:zinc-binding alcohol dehydrogenase family protein [Agrobacterium vitis]MCF1499405.1 zinc-binding alcohol dehydrogenase family protein [Allorhizobium sp. Av2]MBF2717511.1 zinc-binding alcohol dehydrogenase family protein [Agrobacterium vitis]MCM2439343.1 zinc-binding alcohol dehydrogenase family protein [Agrobacterium vitis]MUZ57753.1 zinc-binding dehydrogenase [Agrobacterium vitis]MUZ62662.1 zinc-binding dehydrogenase [Agrobacterium vitis]
MKAAIVYGAKQTPLYGDFEEPVAQTGETLITVSAAALSHLVKSRASGTHYSSSGSFPFITGIDGVGRKENGERVYFALPKAPFGSMAEKTVVASVQCLAVPDDLDDITAAAIVNPGMSSWMAYRERAKLIAGETVLINGATGIAGRLAVQIAKHLGAKKVIATGRNPQALQSLSALGADVTISLLQDEEALAASFKAQFADGVNVVLDYLWGQSAELLLDAAAKANAVPLRFVQVGAVSGGQISLPAAVLRSSAIELMGSGIGSVPRNRMIQTIGELLQAARPAGLKIATAPVALSKVQEIWDTDDSTVRTVLTTGAL